MFQGVDFHFFPLDNPGLISIPLSFLLGILGSLLGKDRSAEERYKETEVRSLGAVGAEKATAAH